MPRRVSYNELFLGAARDSEELFLQLFYSDDELLSPSVSTIPMLQLNKIMMRSKVKFRHRIHLTDYAAAASS